MVELDAVPAPALLRLVGEQGDAGVFASGVDPDLDTVHLGLRGGAVGEADGERGVPGHHRAPFGQELAGPGGRARL
ncbi:hypothetical protein GCM10007079_22820 [Nocardiopsis terrae]|nr:hypothetical protein GCM10007079_22820 [Nocardiopsis terrae]